MSLTTRVFVDNYFLIDSSIKGAWDLISDATKQLYIDRAESEINELKFTGERVNQDQKNFPEAIFPRTYVNETNVNYEEYLNSIEGTIPLNYNKAVAEQVKFLVLVQNFGIDAIIKNKFNAGSVTNFDMTTQTIDDVYFSNKAIIWLERLRKFIKFM